MRKSFPCHYAIMLQGSSPWRQFPAWGYVLFCRQTYCNGRWYNTWLQRARILKRAELNHAWFQNNAITCITSTQWLYVIFTSRGGIIMISARWETLAPCVKENQMKKNMNDALYEMIIWVIQHRSSSYTDSLIFFVRMKMGPIDIDSRLRPNWKPTETWRNINVVITSKRRHFEVIKSDDVVLT